MGSKVFKVAEAQVEGMEHLLKDNADLDKEECVKLAERLQLGEYKTDQAGLKRLARLANILKANPKIVNPELKPADQALYYQVLHDYVDVFALKMGDIATPANVPPFKIRTFGPPTYKPPIRCSPKHAEEIRKQVKKLTEFLLVTHCETPWAAPCFLVAKALSEKLRMVIDYRLLNMQTLRDSHPLPHLWDVLMKVA